MKKNNKDKKISINKIIINYLIFIALFIIGIILIMDNTLYKYEPTNNKISKNKQKMDNEQKRNALSNSMKKAFDK